MPKTDKHKPELVGEILPRVLLELEPTRQETTTRAVGAYLKGQKVRHKPPPAT